AHGGGSAARSARHRHRPHSARALPPQAAQHSGLRDVPLPRRALRRRRRREAGLRPEPGFVPWRADSGCRGELRLRLVGRGGRGGPAREMGVGAPAANGIRPVNAPSLGDIFHQNCFKNGLLPVILPGAIVADFRRELHERRGATVTIDLDAQMVTTPSGAAHRFDIDPFRKQMLLTGRDEIALTLGYEQAIAAFEARHAAEMPWLTAQSYTHLPSTT